jgi:catechol 2,3-dioxygenase-like lactoylglutathione lyase family enzyme
MPPVQQIMETALYVADLDRSERFYHDLFGFPSIFSVDRLRVLSVHDRQVLLLFLKGGTTHGAQTPFGFIPGHDGSGQYHMAYSIDEVDIDAWRATLKNKGITIESETSGPQGKGHAIYFRDPDRHLIELATPSIWGFAS